MSGWLKLHREILDWEWYSDLPTRNVFFHLLLCAEYEPGSWQGIELQPGMIVTGRKKLAQTLGLSEAQIRRSLNNLQTSGEITIKTTSRYSIITLVSWDSYQQKDQQKTNKVKAKEPQSKKLRNKEIKKEGEGLKNPKPAQRIPEDWVCSQELGGWAMEQGLTREEVVSAIDQFTDHWQAASGANARKHDWDAAFRTWVRNEVKWKK